MPDPPSLERNKAPEKGYLRSRSKKVFARSFEAWEIDLKALGSPTQLPAKGEVCSLI